MTSSLVGSEMCIRDSTHTSKRCLERGAAACKEQGASTLMALLLSRNPLPVSYTHLTLPTICSV
eukprot:11200907-Prorocentrum_lima.AAC.1